MSKLSRYILYTTATLVLLLAAASFYISYHALQSEASAMLKTNRLGAYVYPLVVDGATVAFSLWALWAKVNREQEWRGKILALLFTCVSIVANIKHASILSLTMGIPEKALYCILAGLPPLGVFLSLEALLHQVGHYVHAMPETAVAAKITPKEAKTADVAPGSKSKTPKDKRHERIISHLQGNPGATYRELKEVVGVSLSTIKKDIDHLTEAGYVHRNGNGLEAA